MYDKRGCQIFPPTEEVPDFTAKLEVLDGKITGTPIEPDGTVLKEHKEESVCMHLHLNSKYQLC